MSILTNRMLLLMFLFFLPLTSSGADLDLADSHFIYPQYSKKISLDFKNAPLSEVLKVFSKQADMNFVAKTDIASMKVTLYLTDVPIQEALEYILSSNDLEYTALDGEKTFAVSKKTDGKLVTKVFVLKHASVSTSPLKGTFTLSDTSSASSSSSSSGAGGAQPYSSGGGGQSSGSLGGIIDAVKMALSKSGSMVEDSRTNSLIITDTQAQMANIQETIKRLDVAVPQILIDVDMLDISKTTSDLMGAKWGDTIFTFTGSSKTSILPFNQSAALADGKTTLIPVSSSSGSSGSSGSGSSGSSGSGSSGSSSSSTSVSPYTAGKLDFSSMNVVVNFLKTQTDTKNLARPRILTLNNQTAQIEVVTDEAIGVTTTTTGTTLQSQNTTAERYKTGVFLTVTPQADMETREILLAVYPKVVQSRRGQTFGTTTFNDPEERGVKLYLRVKDGQTIILGGLLRNDDSNTLTKVPFLGDIPILGAAFRHKDNSGTKRELVVFLTPHILDDAQTASDQFKRANPEFRWKEVEKTINAFEKE